MLSLHEDDKELLKVASVITEATGTAEILESAMADLMEEDIAMALDELECPATTEEKLLEMALEECETDSQNETVAAGCFFKAAASPGSPGNELVSVEDFEADFRQAL